MQRVGVRRSYPKGVRDALMIHLQKSPLRCRGCTYRFYRRLLSGEKLGRPDLPPEKAPIL